MAASSAVKWDIMPITVPSAMCRLLRIKGNNGQRPAQPSSQAHTGNPSAQGSNGQLNFMRGRVNHVAAETTQEAPEVVLGTFLINSKPASILFDSGATHSFIAEQFVVKHNLPMSPMKQIFLIGSPGKELKASHLCPWVRINIMG